jgi:hypothetical protein
VFQKFLLLFEEKLLMNFVTSCHTSFRLFKQCQTKEFCNYSLAYVQSTFVHLCNTCDTNTNTHLPSLKVLDCSCSMSVAAPGPWLLHVCSCSRSVAALLLVSWLMGSWPLDSWLLVYLRTVRHSWEQINTFLPFLVAFLRISS